MNRTAELMQQHIESCRTIFERMCYELADRPEHAVAVQQAIDAGATLQVLTSFAPLPVIQGVLLDATGQKVELFRLEVAPPMTTN